MRCHDLPVLVLHVRPYRETSALVRVFSRELGRFSGVARGVRGRRRTLRVEPFMIGSVSVSGRGSLVTITAFEAEHEYRLRGDGLSAGFYVLELIDRCLGEYQAESALFDSTRDVLDTLERGSEGIAVALRRFESTLLQQLGYRVDFTHDAISNDPVVASASYEFVPESGFRRASEETSDTLAGSTLLAIAAGDYEGPHVARAARRIFQACLAPLLGPRPLVSRALVKRNTS